MKRIINISFILPLPGLKDENDIILKTQGYLEESKNYKFINYKAIPFVPKIFMILNKKWKRYYEYSNQRYITLKGFKTVLYSWVLPPTSNFYVNYLLLPLNKFFFSRRIIKQLRKDEATFDLILSQNIFPDIFLAYYLAKYFNKPLIVNLRGGFKEKWLEIKSFKTILEESSHIITHSPSVYSKLKKKYRITLIPHPLEKRFYNPTIKIKRDKIQIISVCRLIKLKNLNIVISALHELKNENSDFHYTIVGDGPEMKILTELASKLKLSSHIEFLGYQKESEVLKLLNRSDIFIMPSYPETLGRAFLEAAATGCVIIGHENTGVDGIFKHGESAFFTNKKNLKNTLKECLNLISENQHRKLVLEAQKIVSKFTVTNIVESYDEVFLNSLKNHN